MISRLLKTISKRSNLLVIPLLLLMCYVTSACSRVEAGYVGVKVNLLGGDKGVDSEVLGTGKYWIGWNEELYLFPVFQQTVAWTGEDKSSGAFQFQSSEGLSLSADVSMSFIIDPEKVPVLFQTYRKGIEEITDVYLRNIVRDTMVQAASKRTAENLYGAGKNDFLAEVNATVSKKLEPIGIHLDYVAIIGNVWLPENVKQAIDDKVRAGQLAAQRETEVATAKAEADKAVAAAEGEARSKRAIADANAYALLTEAKAQQEANRILAESLTPELIQYNTINKWDGQLPKVTSDSVPMLQIK
ncbi:hypothetical protein B5F76_07635 [Desulfovibrio sp. An276]|uniref:SPFH domain-containing protein n=1 Tax=Desulfovibrio sp. An276 TaxID=1965618 RepID=UPI000B37179D|nr:SPFH domain-containing protein [Desulfovibrio sp. An276]OUO52289.1 hypothetical protein B5F76_07635 [Desulfovibrio sp. An276]